MQSVYDDYDDYDNTVNVGSKTLTYKTLRDRWSYLFEDTEIEYIPINKLSKIYNAEEKFMSDIPKAQRCHARLFYHEVIKKIIKHQKMIENKTVLNLLHSVVSSNSDYDYTTKFLTVSDVIEDNLTKEKLINIRKNSLGDSDVKHFLSFFNDEELVDVEVKQLTVNLNKNNLRFITPNFEELLSSPKLKWVIIQDSLIDDKHLHSWCKSTELCLVTKVIWLTKEALDDGFIKKLELDQERHDAIASSHKCFFIEYKGYKL